MKRKLPKCSCAACSLCLARARRRRYAKKYPDRVEKSRQGWKAENRGLYLALKEVSTSRRKARKLLATGDHSTDDTLALFARQAGVCACCKIDLVRYEVDHILPMRLGGTNGPKNLQLLCITCNRRKASLHPEDFAAKMARSPHAAQ